MLDASEAALTEFLTEDDSRADGRQGTRRTDSTRFCGREQHRCTRGARKDDWRRATDLAVGGSSPSRRAPTAQVNRPGLFALLAPLVILVLSDG
jgi:hypothetical protein